MLIVLGLYFLVIWLVFFKFKVLPWNKTWKITCYSLAFFIALFVVGALHYFTPTSRSAVVQSYSQRVYPQVTGEVIRSITESNSVSKGDILFEVDPTPFQLAVDSAKANLELTQIKYDDAKTLVEKGVEREKSMDIVTAELAAAKASYDQALFNLKNTKVIASFDGMVLYSTLTVGQIVTPMRPAMTLQKKTNKWLATVIDQTGLGHIEPGTEVKIVFSSVPGKVFDSVVQDVAPSLVQGQVFSDDRTRPIDSVMNVRPIYGLKVALPKDLPSHVYREGTTASVTVFTDPDNPINILAKIIAWISAILTYL